VRVEAEAVAGPLERLCGEFGAVGPVRRVVTDGWLPARYSMYSAGTGNPSAVVGPYRADARAGYGTGRAYGDPGLARIIAASEALERYAGLAADDRLAIVAPAADVGDDALDLASVPRCSTAELRRPGCPVRPPAVGEPIRWVPGTDLLSGKDTLLPGVMVYLRPPRLPGENFWLPISTGCAGHFSLRAAVLGALLEVIERDAIALTWLLRAPLPRLPDDCLSDTSRELADWCRRRGVVTHLFDATTDLGVPVVYCVQLADHAPAGAQLVGCACDWDVRAAAEHAIMETMAIRFGIQTLARRPRRYADFTSVAHGAALMAARARRRVFGFLLDDLEERAYSRPVPPRADSAAWGLSTVLGRIAALGMSAYAADISTREMRDTGYAAVRVIVPELQPMSGRPLVQYRAHPRLTRAGALPAALPGTPRRLNPYPQPMA
jgi:ribosomal protein S12 methylthiotransferase accessory factor